MSNIKWAAEKEAKFLRLINKGWSGGMIAKEMEITRNAVIGKAHRLGLKLKDNTTQCLPQSNGSMAKLTAEERREQAQKRREDKRNNLGRKKFARIYKPSRLLAPWINPVRSMF